MTDFSRPLREDPQIDEATRWLLRLSDEDASGEDVAEWQQWLAQSPDHRAAFERAQAVWQLASQVDRPPWPTDREVDEDVYDASVPVSEALAVKASRSPASARAGAVGEVQAQPGTMAARGRARWRPSLAFAASMSILAVGVGALLYARHAADLLTTHIGENRSVALSDGSRVSLGGATRLRVSIDKESRALDLQSGEAFFEVAKDPLRPFVVHAGDTRITAVGTAFNVRWAADRVQVAVTDGAVKVGETHVDAGKQTIVVGRTVSAPTPAEVPAVLARKAGRLQYASEPLRYVVADLARYSRVPIRIADASAADLLITGTVLESDLKGWMLGLEKALPVAVTFSEEQVQIASRPPR